MMELFGKEHKEQMEKNGQDLRQRLSQVVNRGPIGGPFAEMEYSFCKNLLNNLNSRKVVKK